MSMSLRRKLALRDQAAAVRAGARKAEAVSRTGQVARTTVETVDGSVLVGEVIVDASDMTGVVAEHTTDLEYLDDGSGLDEFDQSQDGLDDAHAAFMEAVGANEQVQKALDDAQDAIDAAANALTTSSGKNSRRRGQTEPEPPPGGWVAGDQWIVDNADGDPVEVRVWNGTEFVHEQLLAAEILVLSGGLIRLANGTVTADAIAADAIDGMVITGAVLRTSATGQRLQLDVNGLRAFNDADEETARIQSDGLGVRFTGATSSAAYSDQAFGLYRSVNNAYALFEVANPLAGGWELGGQISAGDRATILRAYLVTNPFDPVWRIESTDPDTSPDWTPIEIVAPELRLSAPKVTFQGDAESDAYLNRAGGISAPYAIATGTVLIPGASSSVSVTFPANYFTAQPNILTTPLTADVASGGANATNVTTTGMTLHYGRSSNTNVQWTALQLTA